MFFIAVCMTFRRANLADPEALPKDPRGTF